jgi:hypothetical protein
VCGVVAVIAAFINLVYGMQAREYQGWSLWVFGVGVLVPVLPFLIWSFRSDYQKNKRRREYNTIFKTLCEDRDGLSLKELEEVAESEESGFPFNSFPFKLLDDNKDGKISKEEYERGYELVESFREFEAGECRPLCLLLRAKYFDDKKKQKSNVPENTNLARVHPSPAELREPHHCRLSTDRTYQTHNPILNPKCDPETLLQVGCSAVAGQGLRRPVGLHDDNVFGNFMKDPELAIECEILVAGLGGHEDGCIEHIDNYYSIKYGQSGHWEDKEINSETMKIDPEKDEKNGNAPIPRHVKVSAENGKYHGGIFKKEDYDFWKQGQQAQRFSQA